MLFSPRMRERASELNARADVAPNEFKSCRLPTRRVTGAEFAPHTRLNSREEKHEDRFGGTKGTCEFISWHFEELVTGLSSDLTRRGNYDIN